MAGIIEAILNGCNFVSILHVFISFFTIFIGGNRRFPLFLIIRHRLNVFVQNQETWKNFKMYEKKKAELILRLRSL